MANCWLTILFGKEDIHLWHLAECANHGVTDDVGKGNFSATCALKVIIDDSSIINH